MKTPHFIPVAPPCPKRTLIALLLALVTDCFFSANSAGGSTIITRPTASVGAGGDCSDPAVSADGRYAVFVSSAPNLVPGDRNHAADIFVRDRMLGHTILVSVATNGLAGNAASRAPSISADGAWIAFESDASDLVAGDTNRTTDVFLRDMIHGVTILASVSTNGGFGNSESHQPRLLSDGSQIFFESAASNLDRRDTNTVSDLFVFTRADQTVHLLTRQWKNNGSPANTYYAWNGPWDVSADGQRLVFQSKAPYLLLSDTRTAQDVFVCDGLAGTNRLVNATSAGAWPTLDSGNASMSQDGRWVAFESAASLMAADKSTPGAQLDVYLRDLSSNTLSLLSVNTNGIVSSTAYASFRPRISGDGSTVLFFSLANDLVENDTNSTTADLFVRDVTNAITTRIGPVDSTSSGPMPAISDNGQVIVWLAQDYQLHRLDRSGPTDLLIAAGVPPTEPFLTGDGRFLLFTAPPKAAGFADPSPWHNVYLYDNASNQLELVSVPENGAMTDTAGPGLWPAAASISQDGRQIAFSTSAPDLVPDDTNQVSDVFVRDLIAQTNLNVSFAAAPVSSRRGPSLRAVLSQNGRYLAYEAILDTAASPASLDTPFSLLVCDVEQQTNLFVSGLGKAGLLARQSLSSNGNFLTFQSKDTNASPLANARSQIYWRDLSQPTNCLVSRHRDGIHASSMDASSPVSSLDGRYVAFLSAGTDLVTNSVTGTNAYLWDAQTAQLQLLTLTTNNTGSGGASDVRFPGGGSLLTVQVSTNLLVFDAAAPGPADVLFDADQPSATPDGRWLAIRRRADYLPQDTNQLPDVYLLDRTNATVEVVSLDRPQANGIAGESFAPLISPDGRYVAFLSRSSRLATGDLNGMTDIFLRDRQWKSTFAVSLNADGLTTGRGVSVAPVFSGDSHTLIFASYADDLAAADGNNSPDLFFVQLVGGDSDLDGLPDDWEMAYFGTLARDGTGDADGDGISDAAEYRAGTSPTDSDSALSALTVTSVGTGTTTILWRSVPGKNYGLEYKDSLDAPAWTPLPDQVTAIGDTASLTDPTPTAAVHRFYRVVLK